MFLFLFFCKLLLCSFFIISSEKWFNYVVTFFCFENAKNLRRSDDAKRRKKRGWPNWLLVKQQLYLRDAVMTFTCANNLARGYLCFYL